MKKFGMLVLKVPLGRDDTMLVPVETLFHNAAREMKLGIPEGINEGQMEIPLENEGVVANAHWVFKICRVDETPAKKKPR